MAKEIKLLTLEVGELKFGFENPRRISSKKREELEKSLENLGDFGIFLIDEQKNVIGGNQRAKVLQGIDPHTKVTCKMLCGYTEEELRAVNIMDNTSAGEWELDGLAAWTADLNLALGIDTEKKKQIDERTLKEMELIHYEKYDYVLIACRYETDYLNLLRKLGIEGKRVRVCKKRTIQARAIWYDQIRGHLIGPDEEAEEDDAK